MVESQMSSVEFTYDPRKTANQKGDRSLTIPPARSAVCVEKSRDTGSGGKLASDYSVGVFSETTLAKAVPAFRNGSASSAGKIRAKNGENIWICISVKSINIYN